MDSFGETMYQSNHMLTLNLNTLENSSAPGKPDIVDYDNRSVDLKWTAPSVDGGVPIEKYIIEKKDKFVLCNCINLIHTLH